MRKYFWNAVLFCSLSLNVYFIFSDVIIGVNNTFQEIQTSSENITLKAAYSNAALGVPLVSQKSNDLNTSSIESSLILKKIKHAIVIHDYAEAIVLLQRDSPLTTNQRKDVKSFWLELTKTLLNEGRIEASEESIIAYLDYSLDDLDFHQLKVQLLLKQQRVLEAIEHAYSTQYYVYDINTQEQIIDEARMLVQKSLEKHSKEEAWFELSEFCQQVLVFDPQNSRLYWALAQALFHQGSYDEALSNLDVIVDEPNYSVKVQALKSKIEALLQSSEGIALTKQGEHFLVEGYINGNIKVDLLLDTGASISLLSEAIFSDVLRYHDVTFLKNLKLNTAGGIVDAKLYQVNKFAIDNHQVDNLMFAVTPFYEQSNDGLLGMNFLRLFNFHIDQTNQTLFLESK